MDSEEVEEPVAQNTPKKNHFKRHIIQHELRKPRSRARLLSKFSTEELRNAIKIREINEDKKDEVEMMDRERHLNLFMMVIREFSVMIDSQSGLIKLARCLNINTGNGEQMVPVHNTMTGASIDLTGDMDIKEPESKKHGYIPTNLSAADAIAWLRTRRENFRPWSTFWNTNKFRVPESTAQMTNRLSRNLKQFQSNYVLLFLGLVVFFLLTSPLLLLIIGASLGVCYIHLKNVENRVRVFGLELNLAQKYMAVGFYSIMLYFFAGADSAIFWLIGASLVLTLLHASCFATESLGQ